MSNRKRSTTPKFDGILHSPKENPKSAWIVAFLMPIKPKCSTQIYIELIRFDRPPDDFMPLTCNFHPYDEDAVMIAWCYKRDLIKLLGLQIKPMFRYALNNAMWPFCK